MTAEEHLKSLDDYHKVFDETQEEKEYTEEQIILFAESYFKARVNEITDQEISNEANLTVFKFNSMYKDTVYGSFKIGAKWLKQKLLED